MLIKQDDISKCSNIFEEHSSLLNWYKYLVYNWYKYFISYIKYDIISKYKIYKYKFISINFIYQKCNPSMFFLSEISQISWDKLNLSLELIRLLTEVVKKIPSKLTYEHWNFILMSLILWPLSIAKSKQNVTDFKVCS